MQADSDQSSRSGIPYVEDLEVRDGCGDSSEVVFSGLCRGSQEVPPSECDPCRVRGRLDRLQWICRPARILLQVLHSGREGTLQNC